MWKRHARGEKENKPAQRKSGGPTESAAQTARPKGPRERCRETDWEKRKQRQTESKRGEEKCEGLGGSPLPMWNKSRGEKCQNWLNHKSWAKEIKRSAQEIVKTSHVTAWAESLLENRADVWAQGCTGPRQGLLGYQYKNTRLSRMTGLVIWGLFSAPVPSGHIPCSQNTCMREVLLHASVAWQWWYMDILQFLWGSSA